MTDSLEEIKKRVGWTTEEVAEQAGVNPSRIRQLLIEGVLKGFKRGQRQWIIPHDEATRWLVEYKKEKGK